MTLGERRIEYIALDEIKPAAMNPKRHVIDDLILSFKRFGYTIPLLRCNRVGRIAAGNGRWNALKTMRERGDSPPDGITSDWKAPVVVDWESQTDSEFDAYLAADNRLPEAGGWDIREELALLDSLDDLEGTGFTLEDIASLTKSLAGNDDKDQPFTNTKWQVIVECRDGDQQSELVSMLLTEGYDARVK